MRTQTFKDYVLKRESKRKNPFSFSSVTDIGDYTKGYSPYSEGADYADYADSMWTYTLLLKALHTNRVIFPHEVVHCKIAKALFLEDLDT